MPCANRWLAIEFSDRQYHVIPTDDLREHECSGDCWCGPEAEDEEGATLYVHNSMDGREDFETGKRLPS